ncbi:MAG TPA: metallopeptidase TldD-related protein [Pedomonas sp.]
MDEARVASLVADKLFGLEDGELYLQYTLSESFRFEDGQLKSATCHMVQGFGLRGILGETTGFAHSNEVSEAAICRAGSTVATIGAGRGARWSDAPVRTNQMVYPPGNPFEPFLFQASVSLLAEIDAFLRGKDPRVMQVAVALDGSWTVIEILRPDGYRTWDVRPLVRLGVQVVVQQGEKRETGYEGIGGRHDYSRFFLPDIWQTMALEALSRALINLQAAPVPAGEMTVVLGPGLAGMLLHEAIGHGLEGDFNRKGISAFSGRIGERVAAPGVTVVDDGSLEALRGSITIDDEGTPTERTVLIEDGILKGYMQDRMNARLMGVKATGNGRRESFAHAPMPRMTNTFMLAGDRDPADILGSVKKGIYAKTFGGGQVDITSGKFVFSCTEAYELENGRIGRPLKGATLIGHGPDVLTRVKAIGNDLVLDPGIGVCGKGGQSVPTGVGQPTLLIEGLTVGGSML